MVLLLLQTTGPGALNIDLMCQEGQFGIENISFYDDANLGTDLTAEADWKRRGLYIGPQVKSYIFVIIVMRRLIIFFLLLYSLRL